MCWHRLSYWRCLAAALGLALSLAAAACSPQAARLPAVLFLGWDETGRTQLFQLDVDDGTTVQLTSSEQVGEVIDYKPSPAGTAIAYAAELPGWGTEIRLINMSTGADVQVLDCPTAECAELAWAPDGRRLVYERREREGETAGQPYLWWLDTETGESIPLIDDTAAPAYGARFAPDGQWLAYVSVRDQGVVLLNLADGRQHLFDSDTGMPPSWSPDSKSLVASDLELIVVHGDEGDDHLSHSHDYGTAVHLYQLNIANLEQPLRLSPDTAVDDGAPSWSPDGQWLALGRRQPDTASGRQIWLMRPGESESRELTTDPSIHYGPVSWSPDGRFLLYQRYPSFEPDARPSVWLMDVANGEERQLAGVGYLPRWLAPG